MQTRARRQVAGWVGKALSVVLLTGPAAAETLDDAWAAAAAYDLTLKAAQSRVESAEEALLSARGQRLPNVTAASTVMRWNEVPAFVFGGLGVPGQLPLFDSRTTTLSTASVSVPIYTGGRVGNGIDAADAALTARRSEAAALSQQSKLAVAGAYVAVLRAERALEAMASNVAALEAHTRNVNDMFEVGQVPRNDYLAAAVSLADAQQRELVARNTLDVASAAYNRRLGRPLTDAVALDPALPNPASPIDGSTPDALVELALGNRRELAAAAAAAEAFNAQSESARAATRPQLFLTGAYTMLDNEFLNEDAFWTVGVGFQWSFFDSGRTRHAANALSREAAAMNQERDDLETLIALQIREAWLGLHAARERIRVSEQAVAQAEENLRVASDRYRNGEGANTEVLDAEALRSLSRSNYDNAVYDAAYAALALARAVGIL
jgi:outer membrane protein TolC